MRRKEAGEAVLSATRRNSIFSVGNLSHSSFFLATTFRCSFRLFFSHPCLRRRKRRKGRRRSNPTYFPLPHLSSYLGQCPHPSLSVAAAMATVLWSSLQDTYARKETPPTPPFTGRRVSLHQPPPSPPPPTFIPYRTKVYSVQ